MTSKPLIAVSRCLLGDRVRYDATIKEYPLLLNFIKQHFKVISVCPEVEIGLTVPRAPVQLCGSTDNIHILGRDDPSIDITVNMQSYCQQRPPQLDSIHGYIFKSKSPSCGIENIPVHNNGEIISMTKGVFVTAILQHFPKLPITDELDLINHEHCEIFLQLVKKHQQNQTC
ncbi:MAG: hypothetical protein DIZ80_09700 [endosymbiont of Galathealinum brachiosum]|uniref:Uncharacterized protein n=1 Tax=endosymbiont of Galathealinum brachiosum TaxID=2200906 RepID=A0A370DCB7_9GAMM|nr:MAG: hypothetical protein DIZ80_09700 [endosymbiont of Galathealinum brachiosum]